jgi:hypothetical protein
MHFFVSLQNFFKRNHVQHVLVIVFLLGSFLLAGYSAYTLLVSPYAFLTGENYEENAIHSNTASVSNSVTVLSLGDKSASTTQGVISNIPKTLCGVFPKNILNYTLFTKEVTNTPDQTGHTVFVDPISLGVLTPNPDEHIKLTYIPSSYNTRLKIKPTNITAEILRYGIQSDMSEELGKVLGLDFTKDIESYSLKNTIKNGYSAYVYRTGNTVVVAKGQTLSEIQRIAEQVGGACDSKPVFNTGVPKGYVAWRTTNLDRENRIAYVKIADADITLHFDIQLFGNKILIHDDSYTNTLGLSEWFNPERFRIFTIPTKSVDGAMHAENAIRLFVIKAADIQLLLNALQNRQTDIFDRQKEDTVRDTYQTPNAFVGRNIYTYSRYDTDEGTTTKFHEFVYVFSRNNTAFVFETTSENQTSIESLIDNSK